MKHTLGKKERLKSRKLIEKLYAEGKSVKAYPLRMMYIQTEHTSDFPAQVGVSVPKRNFKLAVDRNRIKRLMRESYRLQKSIVYNNLDAPYVFMISYLGKEEMKYEEIYSKMEKLLTLFTYKTKNKEDETIQL
ncbi:ribonuclease P protein component [Polaribacter aestuariivivens]|uniref:Ribonuclease P protein component n=1 Tax=Polaribacter aestuariivivens TaxID=2304626 RepID=A0A5S3N4U4_9FLAO|nr:ribonuclease P protein component [Polaribacter aestuariivivens]TMM29892.1 ribonuclease P protein component [Polaribacter aestuariivivens]